MDEFTHRYSNPKTASDYRRSLTHLFRWTTRRHPSQLTESDLLAWCTSGNPANNTVYQRTSQVCTFLRWCLREGHLGRNPAEHLRGPDSPLRTFRRTFGKVQAKHPGRWLTHQEAYGCLVGSCQDGTTIGLRDEIVLRLGLAGMRLSEIGYLSIGDVARLPLITWAGKGRTPRKMTAGHALSDAIRRYLVAYPDPQPQDPLICRQVMGAARQGGPPPHRLAPRPTGPLDLLDHQPPREGSRTWAHRPARPTTNGRRNPPPGDHG